MIKIDIKPLSINEAYSGVRYKTKACKKYCRDLAILLPKKTIDYEKIQIKIDWGFSSKGSDIDNAAKVFIDTLQKKYKFNDNQVYSLILTKSIVKKGEEYIKFDIFEWFL